MKHFDSHVVYKYSEKSTFCKQLQGSWTLSIQVSMEKAYIRYVE